MGQFPLIILPFRKSFLSGSIPQTPHNHSQCLWNLALCSVITHNRHFLQYVDSMFIRTLQDTCYHKVIDILIPNAISNSY